MTPLYTGRDSGMVLESPAFKSQRELSQQRRLVTGEGGNVGESGLWKMMERKLEVVVKRRREVQ